MPHPLSVLLIRARHSLIFNQAQLAEHVGSSLRTVQRWETGATTPADFHLHRVADAIRSANPQLAAELDAHAPRPAAATVTVDTVPTVSPVTPPVVPPVPVDVLVDAIVCAAAEAMELRPQAVRPALLAAFTRARDTGVTHDAMVTELTRRAT